MNVTRIRVKGIGPIWIAKGPKGICKISFGGSKRKFLSEIEGNLDSENGTTFQKRVWRAIATIPWGESRSYAWLARKAGRPKAIRATANACGKNPLPLIIPCHRVIASDGSLGGFSGGVEIKKRLLKLEGTPYKEK